MDAGRSAYIQAARDYPGLGDVGSAWRYYTIAKLPPDDKMQAAKEMRAFVCRDLGIMPFRVHWLREIGEEEAGRMIRSGKRIVKSDLSLGGIAWPRRSGGAYHVGITHSQSIEDIRMSVAHEARHVYQYTRGIDTKSDAPYWERPCEIDAYDYADKAMELFKKSSHKQG